MTSRRVAAIHAGIASACLMMAVAAHGRWWWSLGASSAWLGIGAGFACAALALLLMPPSWRQQCDELSAQPAGRRYQRALWPIMACYVASLLASIALIKHGIASLPLRALVAVAPALTIVMLLRAALRYWRDVDELQRRIETEAIGIASLLVALAYFAGGLLQKAQVVAIDAGAAMIWVFPALVLVYGITKMIVAGRYR